MKLLIFFEKRSAELLLGETFDVGPNGLCVMKKVEFVEIKKIFSLRQGCLLANTFVIMKMEGTADEVY